MKQLYLILGGLVLVLGVAGAAFLAGRQLNPAVFGSGVDNPDQAAGAGARERVLVMDQGQGPVRITFRDPDVLPEGQEVFGVFKRRQDNSLYIGTGNITVELEVFNDQAQVSASSDGPELEVVVTVDTVIYADVTEQPILAPEDVERGELVVERQVKKVDSLDEIGPNMIIRAWGEQRGDRVVADVLVFEPIK